MKTLWKGSNLDYLKHMKQPGSSSSQVYLRILKKCIEYPQKKFVLIIDETTFLYTFLCHRKCSHYHQSLQIGTLLSFSGSVYILPSIIIANWPRLHF